MTPKAYPSCLKKYIIYEYGFKQLQIKKSKSYLCYLIGVQNNPHVLFGITVIMKIYKYKYSDAVVRLFKSVLQFLNACKFPNNIRVLLSIYYFIISEHINSNLLIVTKPRRYKTKTIT